MAEKLSTDKEKRGENNMKHSLVKSLRVRKTDSAKHESNINSSSPKTVSATQKNENARGGESKMGAEAEPTQKNGIECNRMAEAIHGSSVSGKTEAMPGREKHEQMKNSPKGKLCRENSDSSNQSVPENIDSSDESRNLSKDAGKQTKPSVGENKSLAKCKIDNRPPPQSTSERVNSSYSRTVQGKLLTQNENKKTKMNQTMHGSGTSTETTEEYFKKTHEKGRPSMEETSAAEGSNTSSYTSSMTHLDSADVNSRSMDKDKCKPDKTTKVPATKQGNRIPKTEVTKQTQRPIDRKLGSSNNDFSDKADVFNNSSKPNIKCGLKTHEEERRAPGKTMSGENSIKSGSSDLSDADDDDNLSNVERCSVSDTDAKTNLIHPKMTKQHDISKTPSAATKKVVPDKTVELGNVSNTISGPESNENTQSKSRKGRAENCGEAESRNEPRSKFVSVVATKNEISEIEADIIVSSEDAALRGFGLVARHLRDKGEKMYTFYKEIAASKIGLLKDWSFILTPGEGRLQCKKVLHVHVPKMSMDNQDTWYQSLRYVLHGILERVNCMGFTSVALPLLGTGRNGAPIDIVIDIMSEELSKFLQKSAEATWLQYIYVVHPDKKIVKAMEDAMKTSAKTVPCGSGITGIKKSGTKTAENARKTSAKTESAVSAMKVIQKDVTKTNSRDKNASGIEQFSVASTKSDKKSVESCPICLENIADKERLELVKCHHTFCKTCIEQSFLLKPVCPICNVVYGKMQGNQPDGCMIDMFHNESLPGYEGCGIIHFFYYFLDGKQKGEHPHPGKLYRGAQRDAFLPDNDEGKKVHRLLRRCFEQRLTFTIGSSRTSGREDVVTWNDVHHKTKTRGGPERFGYPDPTYLQRVTDELADKGITDE